MFQLYQLKSKIASFKKKILKHNTSHEYNLSNVEQLVHRLFKKKTMGLDDG